MDTVTFMKEAGILSNKVLRAVSELVLKLDTLSPTQLVDFTLMYSSSEMQSAIDISEHVSNIENALIANSNKFTISNFANICSVVAFDDARDGEREVFNLQLPVFLHQNQDRVKEWLASDRIIEMQDFVYISAAYLSMYDDGRVPADLLSLFEHTIEVNSSFIDASQAIYLAQIFSKCGSSYTMEVFDRIIGSNIEDVPIPQVFQAYLAF